METPTKKIKLTEDEDYVPLPKKEKKEKLVVKMEKDCFTIKMSLMKNIKMKILKKRKLEEVQFNKFARTINDCVYRSSVITYEAWLFVNLYVMNAINSREVLPVLDNSFFSNVLRVVSYLPSTKHIFKSPSSTIWQACIDRYNILRGNSSKQSRTGINVVLNYIAKKMETSSSNHIILNLIARLFKYIKWKLQHLDFKFKNKKDQKKKINKESNLMMKKLYNDEQSYFLKDEEQFDDLTFGQSIFDFILKFIDSIP